MSPSTMKPFQVLGPWKGLVGDLPSGSDPTAWDQAVNILFRKGRIQSRPPFVTNVLTSPTPPDGTPILGLYSFQDVLNGWHTLVLTGAGVYFLSGTAGALVWNALTLPNGITASGNQYPYSIVEYGQKVFFCNGQFPLMFVDGSQNVQIAGNAGGSCLYLTENSGSLIGVNWNLINPYSQNQVAEPFLVQISDVGDPTQWIPTISNTAQLINLIEKGGVPTGVCTLGLYTYVWRAFGANVLWPTGQASANFYNEPFTWSNPGWGNFYPYALAVWNQQAIMVSHGGDVLMFNGVSGPSSSGWQSLAQGKIKTQIAESLTLSAPTQVLGFITDNLGAGYDFVAYHLWITGLGQAFIYNIEEGTWSTMSLSNAQYATAFANVKVS